MPFVQTAKYPTAVAALTDLLNLKNKVPSEDSPTLSTAINAATLTIPLTTGDGAKLPADNFVISIEDEIIKIDSRSSDTLTANASGRGYEGSTAATHAIDSVVEARLTAQQLNQAMAEINAMEAALGVTLLNVFNTVVSTAAASATLANTQYIINATGGAPGITLTLPTAVGRANKVFFIKKADAGAGAITIGGTIDGTVNYQLVNQYQTVAVYSDGSNWFILFAS